MLVCIHCSPQLRYLKGLWEALRGTSSPESSGMGAGNDLGVEGKVREGRGGIGKGFVGFASVRNEQDDTHPQNKLVCFVYERSFYVMKNMCCTSMGCAKNDMR